MGVCTDSNSEAGIVLTDHFPAESGNKMKKIILFSDKLDYWIIRMKNVYWIKPINFKKKFSM